MEEPAWTPLDLYENYGSQKQDKTEMGSKSACTEMRG